MIQGELNVGHSHVWAEGQYLGRYFPSTMLSKHKIFQYCHRIGSCCIVSYKSVCSPAILGKVYMFGIVWLIYFLVQLCTVFLFPIRVRAKGKCLCWKHTYQVCTMVTILEWNKYYPKPKNKMCASGYDWGCQGRETKMINLCLMWRQKDDVFDS